MGRIGTAGLGRGHVFGVGVGNSGRTYRCTRGRSGGGIGNSGRILGDGADMKLLRGTGM